MGCEAGNTLLGRKVGQRSSLDLVSRADPNVVEAALLLGLDLDEPKAIIAFKRIALDEGVPADRRGRALAALVERRVPGLAPTCKA